MTEETKRTYTVDNSDWWQNFYQTENTPWELGKAAPPFESLLKSTNAPTPGKIIVPGCGRGNECLLFAAYGYEVTGVDFADGAIAATTEKFQSAGILGVKGHVLQHDIFALQDYAHTFDYVLEHTCFCAIHPRRRLEYVEAIHNLLKPGGKLIGLFFLQDQGKEGPPYPVSKAEILEIFQKLFVVEYETDPADSVSNRQGKELLAVMRAK